MMKKHDVFISYSSKEMGQAERIRDILEVNDIVCWMAPRDISPGENYAKVIPKAIKDCKVFLLILSENAQHSKFVPKELDMAVTAGKLILPFMLEDCPLIDEFNFLLTGAQRFFAYQQISVEMEKLVKQIWINIGFDLKREIILPNDIDIIKYRKKNAKKGKKYIWLSIAVVFMIAAIELVCFILKDEQRYADERAEATALYYGETFLRTSDDIRKTVSGAVELARKALESCEEGTSSTQDFDIDPFREYIYNEILLRDYLISSGDAEYIY